MSARRLLGITLWGSMNELTTRSYKAVARRVLQEDVDVVVGRLTSTHERHMKMLEDALSVVTPGSKMFLEYVTKLESMENAFTELMQSLSVLPKTLGNSTMTKFEFTSTVGIMPPSGRDVNQFNPKPRLIEGEVQPYRS
jgi:hypothetical protein